MISSNHLVSAFRDPSPTRAVAQSWRCEAVKRRGSHMETTGISMALGSLPLTIYPCSHILSPIFSEGRDPRGSAAVELYKAFVSNI
jgi:hypothetical protein